MPYHLHEGGGGTPSGGASDRRGSSSRIADAKTLPRGKSGKLGGAAGRPASPRGVRRTPTGLASPRGASGGKGAIARGRSSSLHPAAAPAAAEAEEDKKDIDAGIDFLKVRIRRDPGTKRHSEGPSPDMLGMSNGPGMAEDDAVRVIQKACTVRLKAQNHGFQAPSH